MKSSPARTQRGFTLLELSIVLLLIAVILGGGLAMFTSSLQASQYNKTVERMDKIEAALLNYAIANNRIPCPSDLTQTVSSATYGFEAGAGTGSAITAATGVCTGTGMTPQANFVAASGTVEGGVPTRALQLPDEYMYDGWGRRFRYAVDPTMTKIAALPAAVSSPCSASSPSAIAVNDAAGSARTTTAIYAIVSHGANGHGAYTSSGVAVNAGSVNTDEQTNCHCTSAGAYTGTYTPTYVEKVPMQDASNALDNFDDIVTFKEGWQMQAQNYPLSQTVGQCIYVVDSGNARVQKFSSSGTYLSQLGCASGACSSSSANGQFDFPENGVTVDSGGNIWVTDSYDHRVQKFNSSGIYQMGIGAGYQGVGGSIGSSGSANGQFYHSEGIAVSVGGNVWVLDSYNNRVQEFNSSGAYLSQFGSGGTGNGQFNYSEGGIAIDASSNIWVVDSLSNRVQKFNSSGTYQSQLGCASGACSSGSANGQFNQPEGIAIDASGDIWVADASNNRAQEFNSSGTWLASLGGTSTACASCLCTGPAACPSSTGTGTGQFNFLENIAIDASGNLWAVDTYNNRVQEFSSSGIYLRGTGTGYQGVGGSIGATGTANGQFNEPQGIAVGSR